MINYDNVTLVPRVISEVESRTFVNTSVHLREDIVLDVPIIASPMPDVCGVETAFTLRRCGALGIIHRFQPIEEQLDEFSASLYLPEIEMRIDVDNRYAGLPPVGCAIGVTDDYKERYTALYNGGCRIFCIDTANGFNRRIENAVLMVKEGIGTYVIAGNVATWEGYQFLAELGVDAVRVGIAGGSVCTTRHETGVYMPTLESVREIAEFVDNQYGIEHAHPAIIADGGIRYPSDMAKALAVGADAVMGGRIFAGYLESPGTVIHDRINSKFYKLYRGAASHGVQKEVNGEKPDYNEGAEELVPFIDKSVSTVIKRFQNGLRSTMSYMNATTISQFRANVKVEKL